MNTANAYNCRNMLTTGEKLLLNHTVDLISVRAGDKTIVCFDNENVEHMIKSFSTS